MNKALHRILKNEDAKLAWIKAKLKQKETYKVNANKLLTNTITSKIISYTVRTKHSAAPTSIWNIILRYLKY